MRTFNRILLVSDFSPSAEAALLYAAAWARRSQARLLVLHVIDTRVAALPHWTDIFRSIEVFADRQTAVNDALQKLHTHPALSGLQVDTLVQHGRPREHIVDVAANVDFVVMGRQTATDATTSRMDQTAHYVAHGSPVPVLFVPAGGGSAGLPPPGATHLPLRHILLALHFAHYAPQAITLTQQLAVDCHATLQALQVLDPDNMTSYPLEAGVGLYHNRDAVKTILRKRLADIMPDDSGGAVVERLIAEGDPATVIVQQSIERGTDLVVLGAHAYGLWQKFFQVSTVDTVLEQALCPVLTVPLPRSAAAITTAGTVSVSVG